MLRAAFVSLIITLCVVGIYSTLIPEHDVQLQKPSFDKISEAGEIKCGYLPYPPDFIIDPNTQRMSGIFYEAIEKIGADAGIKINWVEEGGYVGLIQSLVTGRIDAICSGLWLNTEKSSVVDFSDSLFFHELGVFVRSDDKRFDNDLKKLNDPNVTFAVIDGALADQISKSDFPKAKQNSLPELSDYPQLLMEVTSGKADATISATSEMYVYSQNNRDKLRKVETDRPLRVFPNVFFVKKGNVDLLNFLNAGIRNLQYNRFIDQLIDKYQPAPETLLRVQKAYN